MKILIITAGVILFILFSVPVVFNVLNFAHMKHSSAKKILTKIFSCVKIYSNKRE